jgi:hypothetical protein
MLKTKNLGDSANTTELAEFNVGDLEDVYVSIDGTFSATGTVEISFNGGTTWEAYGSSTSAKAMIGPLPKCQLVRGKNSARASGTVSYRLGGNVKRYLLNPVQELKTGLFGDIVPTVASQMQTITCVTVANIAAGGGTNDKFTVTDGTTLTTFEYKKDGSFVAVAGRTTIDVSGVSSAIEVAVATAAAIAAAYPTTLSVPVPTTAVLSITAAEGKTVLLTETVNNSGFLLGAVNQGIPVPVGRSGAASVWIKAGDFIGTYAVSASFDGGATWAYVQTPTVSSGSTTAALITCMRATHLRIEATAYTSGTLSARYGAAYETQV